jgi:hypothetical protein
MQWVLSGPGLDVGYVMLAKQRWPDLVWPVDIMLGVGSGAILSGR